MPLEHWNWYCFCVTLECVWLLSSRLGGQELLDDGVHHRCVRPSHGHHFLRNIRVGWFATVGWADAGGAEGLGSGRCKRHQRDFIREFVDLSCTIWNSIRFFSLSQNEPGAMSMQINNSKQVSYGATEYNPFNQQQPIAPAFNPTPGNPFANPSAFPSAIQEEPVQPYATDAYMHGTVEDRSFQRDY